VPFQSILYRTGDVPAGEVRRAPECFGDLHLDRIVAAITNGKEEYDLAPFFYAPLSSLEAIAYRHEVIRDLQRAEVFECVTCFAKGMRAMRRQLEQSKKLYYEHQKARWVLHAAETYCESVRTLKHALARCNLHSTGLIAFRDALAAYADSQAFVALSSEQHRLTAELTRVRYCVHISGNGFRVRTYEGEPDLSAAVSATFEKFRQGGVKDYRVKFSSHPDMNHVEAKILEFVARLCPETFARLLDFASRTQTIADPMLARFDREVEFYVAYLEYAKGFEAAGLTFCEPELSAGDKAEHADESFDLALAGKLVAENGAVVCNGYHLSGAERIIVVSGPNQGGKTTFARMFGQLHYLAALGCPVPGKRARIFLADAILTHFPKEESIETLRGKLEDDLVRMHAILERATPNSVAIVNEIFNSTTLQDAVFLAREVVRRISVLDALCVCVTFLDELASLNEKTVSMVSTVLSENPAVRTFKVLRRRADGRAYAISIAEKYGLTYDDIVARIVSGEAAR
jgi:DNA mismatch repair protein MutS